MREICAPRSRSEDRDDLLALAVDQATSPESRRVTENRLSRSSLFIFFFGRWLRRNDDLQRGLISFMPHSGGVRRLLLDIARHQVDFVVGQFARGSPVRHAAGRAILDEDLEVLGAAGKVLSVVSGLPVAPLRSTP
jgi:hypothetical protein